METIDLKLPAADKIISETYVVPIFPEVEKKGWDTHETLSFKLILNVFAASKKTAYKFYNYKLMSHERRMSRPSYWYDKKGKRMPCLCKECMAVHKDKKHHSKTQVLWKAKK